MTSDSGAPGERDVTTSHQTARTSDNGLAETKLVHGVLRLLLLRYLNNTCVSLSSFSSKIDFTDGLSGPYQGVISGNGQTNEGISGHHLGSGRLQDGKSTSENNDPHST